MRQGHALCHRVVRLSLAGSVSVLLLTGCASSATEISHSNWQGLGIFQARIGSVQLPDSIRSRDTLDVIVIASPDTGVCPSLSRIDLVRDSASMEMTVWMEAHEWLGPGAPPPCSLPVFRYLAPPPFAPGWFALRGHQPAGGIIRDSVLVRAS